MDGMINIFDLVLMAGNFGQSLLASPAMVDKIELSTEQKRHLAIAIDQLESIPNRSSAEEMVPNVLMVTLPKRLPAQTQLLPNYPNPFTPRPGFPLS